MSPLQAKPDGGNKCMHKKLRTKININCCNLKCTMHVVNRSMSAFEFYLTHQAVPIGKPIFFGQYSESTDKSNQTVHINAF